jgi:hypothetical protein
MISDFKNNFKIGTCNAAKWTDWQETEGLTRKHIRGYSGRYIPFTHPYFDGSNWYKAVAFGKFKYRNDST